MSLDACIPDMVAKGELTKEQGERAMAVYGRYQRQHRRAMAPAAADALASEDAVKALMAEAAQVKRQQLLQVKAQRDIIAAMASYDGGSGKHPGAAALALFDHDGRAPYANVEAQRNAIRGRAHAMMEEILHRHSRNIAGNVRKPAELRDLARAAFGEAVDSDGARQLADAWGQTAEMLRRRFNAAGGAIGKLENWGLPQSHNAAKVRAAGFEPWRDELLPRLDRARMIDEATGRPFDDETLNDVLHDVFRTIRSDGLVKLAPGGQGRGKLANSRAAHRFLIFKSADDWLAYAEKFGEKNVFDVMIGHIERMARDIAHMEVLGPNPAATVKWLRDGLTKAAAIDDRPDMGGIARALSAEAAVARMYAVTSGELASPVNPKIAYGFGVTRSLLTSAMLGSAAISALTDVGFQAVTRGFNGLPVTGAMTGYLKLLNPLARSDRRMAVRLGLIADEAAKMGSAQNRYLGEAVTGEVAGRLAEGVLRVSGLSAWTQAGRWAFGMETLGHLADQAGKPFDRLEPALARLLQRYGIGAAEWDTLRATPLYEHKGATFLRPADVADEALGDRLLRLVRSETAYAVPEATARSRAIMTAGRPGSLLGEISRNVALFKSFGVSMILTHGRRAIQQQAWSAAKYAAGLVVTTTLLGALSLQLKEIVKGKDMRPMNTLDFWGDAMLQGGGFGIFGDFLGSPLVEAAAGENPRPASFAEAAAGPVAGAIGDAADLAVSPIAAAISGKPRTGRRVVRDIKRYTPGSSLWYARLAFERLIADQLQMQIDPNYPAAWRSMERRAAQRGQGLWWEPGELTPGRMPEMGEAP